MQKQGLHFLLDFGVWLRSSSVKLYFPSFVMRKCRLMILPHMYQVRRRSVRGVMNEFRRLRSMRLTMTPFLCGSLYMNSWSRQHQVVLPRTTNW